ncbi:T9SS type A sorting domain-containing protein [Hymenobacter radiodurans]|uniref:T9SS type A sorting domain-containing protein n=1 Tax=Hymenobacter radiodurans TaxID=2496028 RepID=UPI001058806C|nr:T9SS type A sorting domain-containing protein [Hymenobacter radiodurans]
MKAPLLSLLLLGGLWWSGTAAAQSTLANGTFEAWATQSNVEAPTQWITSDEIGAAILPLAIGGVTKSTEAHAGQFAARLTFKNISIPLVGNFPIPAVLLLGTETPLINPNNLPRTQEDILRLRPGGIPFTARPTAMQFWFKYTGTSTETGQVGLVLSKEGTIVGQTSIQLMGGVPDYRLINLPITYSATTMPDTLRIFFVAGTGATPSPTASLFVDDVTLPLTVTADRSPQLEAALVVYPNPSANGEFSLASLQKPSVATAPFTISDAAGRIVQRQGAAPISAASGRLISLRGQPAGVYLLRLSTPEGTLTRKLLIQ